MPPADPEIRSDALTACWAELRDAGEEADAVAGGLAHGQLWWRPGDERWSIGECLDHLVRTGEAYLEALDDGIREGRRRSLVAAGPHRRTLWGRWLPRWLEPPPRLRIRAPARIRPRPPDGDGPTPADPDPLPRFLALRGRIGERLEAADGLDLGRVRVTSPFVSFFRFDLESAFRIVAAHERRHLWQARQVRETDGFPGG